MGGLNIVYFKNTKLAYKFLAAYRKYLLFMKHYAYGSLKYRCHIEC